MRRPGGEGMPLAQRAKATDPVAAGSGTPGETNTDAPSGPRQRRTRLVLVATQDETRTREGFVVEWAQDGSGAWLALVVSVVEESPESAYAVQRWVAAELLTPVRRP
jgi:hypothetical protein